MAAAGLKAAGGSVWKSGGVGVQLVAAAASTHSCASKGSGDGRAGCSQPRAHQHQSAGHSPPPPPPPSLNGKVKRAGDSSHAATAPLGSPVEGVDTKSYLWARYHEMKKLVYDLLPPGVCSLLNPAAIYANNEISLGDVEIYGFDYDYTLAQYSNLLHSMIFNTARDILIEQFKYPEGLRKYEYIPGFAIRGLHYDVHKSLLMKIDAFHYVQLGTAYQSAT